MPEHSALPPRLHCVASATCRKQILRYKKVSPLPVGLVENESKRMEPQLAPKRLYLAVQCLKRWGLMAEIAVLGTTEFGFTP
jgi:hypothetical protein